VARAKVVALKSSSRHWN